MANKFSKKATSYTESETYRDPAIPVFDDDDDDFIPAVGGELPPKKKPSRRFAIDDRLSKKVRWMRRYKLAPGVSFSIYLRKDMVAAIKEIAKEAKVKPGIVVQSLLDMYAEDNPDSTFAKRLAKQRREFEIEDDEGDDDE